MSALVRKVPKRLGELLDPEGTVEFVDFLNRAFGESHSNTIEAATDRFERRLSEESGKLRSEISEIHKAISLQTKWILGVAIGSIGVFSIIVKF
ncbi:hypothetical protein LEP1GSC193_3133 [Leptospira alstonii serovar Pingchang str. 80-412]|uniref:Uncharacterized protein n=3 Tax=Leptospira alstonii TaxID=28452 RepID=M6CXV1_9LEPT|nr:hypothetical protein LEP1GSC194_0088 [Leptospira alstonii serovar Sichuan str. 79601]EQA80778.1 hypothetical protein LEP1GSC193_3133 [Leptospira alstonii serovar Pingchang str. 80-412]